jgi:hypothetical protein
MAKYRILAAAAAPGVLASLDAPGRAARVRGTCGSSIGLIVASTWDGAGNAPLGWTLPVGLLPEIGGARIAIVATDTFAAGRPEFSSAVDQLPGDWA